MNRLFLDTNIVLDFITERTPFFDSIASIISLVDKNDFTFVVTPLSYATIFYLTSKNGKQQYALDRLVRFKIVCEICIMDEQIVESALHANMKDFEDALQYFSALKAGCDVIITRNGKDFKKSDLPIMTPSEFLSSINRS
jgi:predicted nucleic acid-binding protein